MENAAVMNFKSRKKIGTFSIEDQASKSKRSLHSSGDKDKEHLKQIFEMNRPDDTDSKENNSEKAIQNKKEGQE